MVVVRLLDGRAHCHPGVMQELVLQSGRHVRDRLAVGLGQARPARIKRGKLALANLIGMVSKLLEQEPDVPLVPQLRQQAIVSLSIKASAGSTPFCRESRFCSACALSSSTW